ncbi:uncharacterized protein [Rutidosis leptorrhynchoides]|uniref:uncharacterized protein isoform X2 n=1 Tax=Rutidosis leptorrhynchoides TaxID=125765 RepID=UPI003A9A00AB
MKAIAVVVAAATAATKSRNVRRKLQFSSIRDYSIMISTHINNNTTLNQSEPSIYSVDHRGPHHHLLSVPWSANQIRFAKARGSDVRPGNVIERKGKVYQVVKAQHSTQGRGGAIIQVELRDVDSGNKVNERFRTDETVEKIYVESKAYTYLYTDEETDSVVLMEPMSASVPKRVTCTVAEAQVQMKGMGATPHNKKVLLDNGLRVEVPPHVLTGDKILIDTTDNSYISRA